MEQKVEVKEAGKDTILDIMNKERITGTTPNGSIWGLPDYIIDEIDKMGDFVYIRKVGSHIEIGTAQVNFIR